MMETGISRSLRARSEYQYTALNCSSLAESYISLAQIVEAYSLALAR